MDNRHQIGQEEILLEYKEIHFCSVSGQVQLTGCREALPHMTPAGRSHCPRCHWRVSISIPFAERSRL